MKRLLNFSSLGVIVLLSVGAGCHSGVPIQVWRAPKLESVAGKRVLLGEISGDRDVADELQRRLINGSLRATGRRRFAMATIDVEDRESPFRLASSVKSNQSDLALGEIARRRGYDFILTGEILGARGAMRRATAGDRLAVSWRLESLDSGGPGSGGTRVYGLPVVAAGTQPQLDEASASGGVEVAPGVVVTPRKESDASEAVPEFPEEVYQDLVAATYGLLVPTMSDERVELLRPYGLPGARAVRHGNTLASGGDWTGAREVWRAVARRHPWHFAAFRNLAIAEVAHQEFAAARVASQRSVRLMPLPSSQAASVWIEMQQREYHRAFGLPDPAEGWRFTHSEVSRDESAATPDGIPDVASAVGPREL